MMTCRVASTQEEKEAIFQQRHEVFVEELNFETPREDGVLMESDQYDDHAMFLGVWKEKELLASCRLIFNDDTDSLPTCKHALINSPLFQDNAKTAEISRFIIAPTHRVFAESLRIFRLMQKELDRLSHHYAISQLIASIEPEFLHLLNKAHLPYQPIGPLQHYFHSNRYPIILNMEDRIAALEERGL